MTHLIEKRSDCLPIGTRVRHYDRGTLQGERTIVGYARNDCYVLREDEYGTTVHAFRHWVEAV